MSTLNIENLRVAIDHQQLLNGIDLDVNSGELVVVLGSNGAGKSTLLKCIAGLQNYQSGTITWSGQSLAQLDSVARAKVLTYLPQDRPTSWPIRVEDVVSLGRYAYGVNLGQLKGGDRQAVDQAIEACDLRHLTDRSVNTLSGGEQARVHCARTFAAESPLLLADEPTTSLDPKHQLEIMELLHNYVHGRQPEPTRLNNQLSRSAIVILHEPGLAARFADRLVWLKGGKIIADGSPTQTLNRDVLAETYEIDASVRHDGEHPYIEIHRAL